VLCLCVGFGDVKWFTYSSLRSAWFDTHVQVQRLHKQQQSDKGQFQVCERLVSCMPHTVCHRLALGCRLLESVVWRLTDKCLWGRTELAPYVKLVNRNAVFTTRYYDCVVYALTVCPSVCVCLAVLIQFRHVTDKHRIMQTMPHDSPGTLVFLCQRSWQNPSRVTLTGALNTGGVRCELGLHYL